MKNNLRLIRINKGISQIELAHILHVSQASISYYENGGGFNLKHLFMICKYFDITPNDLFDTDTVL